MNRSKIHPTNSPQDLIQFLKEENLAFKKLINGFQDQVTELKEQLEWCRKQIFGKKSERYIDTSSSSQMYFPGTEDLEPAKDRKVHKVAGHKRRSRKPTKEDTIDYPEDLPVETEILDLSDKKKICKETGLPLVKIGQTITDQLGHKPGSFFIKRTIRPKYAMPKGAEEGIRMADLPDSIISGTQSRRKFIS